MRTSFTVNDMTIHRIVEQEDGFTPIFEFLPSLSQELFEENRSWMEPAALDPKTGMSVLCFQSYVVKTPHHTILVDACIGNDKSFPHRPAWHRKKRQQLDAGAEGRRCHRRRYRLRHVHASARRPCRLEYAAGERPLGPDLSECPIPVLEKGIRILGQRPSDETPLDPMKDSVLPIIEAKKAELVTSDHALNDHIRLTPTPGHTPDHFAVCAGRGGDQAVFTGDLIHSPIQARYPDLVMRVDSDRDQASRPAARFFERYCDTDTLCCTMHFPSPSVGHIKRWGDGFRLEYVKD